MELKKEYEELYYVMAEPVKKIPSLSQDDIKLVLIQVLLAYIERMVDFKVILTVSNLLEQYVTITLSEPLNGALKEIHELKRHHDIIEEILTDILQDLIKKDSK